MRKIRFSGITVPGLVMLCFSALSGVAQGSEITVGKLRTEPQILYVGQPFQICFELEIVAGLEIENLRISDFPSNPELIVLGRLEPLARRRFSRDGHDFERLEFAADARCLKPVEHTFHPALRCILVKRRSFGFFSQWHSQPQVQPLADFKLHVRPLPTADQPAAFSGAVGVFQLTGTISQGIVCPGDIITLQLEVQGKGWLGEATMPQIAHSTLFRSYAPREITRDPQHLVTEQVIIPQTTNATEVAALGLVYFNPFAEKYETTTTGPFSLQFDMAKSQPVAPPVRMLEPVQQALTEGPGVRQVELEQRNRLFSKNIPLLILFGGVLTACFFFFLLREKQLWVALALAGIIFSVTLAGALRFKQWQAARTLRISHQTEARLAPAQSAAHLFTIPAGVDVIPLETYAGWLRVDAGGQRGWICRDAVGQE